MGFSGGGANITKNHQHDGAVVQDGGELAANATQFGLTNGSLLVSDGTNIQELGVGASGYVLGTASGTIPTWESSGGGGGGSLTLIDNTVLGGNAVAIDTTFAALEQGTDMSGIFAIFNGARSDSNGLYLNVNGITANYDYQGIYVDGGVAAYENSSSQGVWDPFRWGNGAHGIKISMIITATDPSMAVAASQSLQFTALGIDSGNVISYYGGTNTTASITTIDEVKFSSPTGTILAGSSLALYKIGV